MSVVTIKCKRCGAPAPKDAREVKRSLKLARPMYCTQQCASIASNASIKAPTVERTCPCGNVFTATTKVRSSDHCSRGCASRYSVTDFRRERARITGAANSKMTFLTSADVLKRREHWKYARLRKVLRSRVHEFEFPLDGYVFDLALLDARILVEFDGPYHATGKQVDVDAAKDAVARANDFTIVRRTVPKSTVISPRTIAGL